MIKKINIKYLFILLIIIQILVCLYYGNQKKYLFCDEVYSYGLSNSKEYTFLDPINNKSYISSNEWFSSDYFRNYMEFDSLSLKSVYINQARDVHPPLYYLFLHLFCGMFQNTFYNPMIGILLNIIFLLFVDLFLFKISKYILKKDSYAFLVVLFYGLSPICISTVMFIRMYMLLTLAILIFIYAQINLLENKNTEKKFIYPFISLSIVLGGLTHYYFYVFIFPFIFLMFLHLRKDKENRKKYFHSCFIGGLICFATFPLVVFHLLGYQGLFAVKSAARFSISTIKYYLNVIDNSLFGNLLIIIIPIFIIFLLIFIFNNFKKKLSNEKIIFIFMAISVFIFFCISMNSSAFVNSRYIYPCFPIFAIIFIKGINYILNTFKIKKSLIINLFFITILISSSFFHYEIDWLYKEYNKAQTDLFEMKNGDCIIISRDKSWTNVNYSINAYANMENCAFVFISQLDDINDLINKKHNDNNLYIAFTNDTNVYSEEEKIEILEKILKLTKYDKYELSYSYIDDFYLISCN